MNDPGKAQNDKTKINDLEQELVRSRILRWRTMHSGWLVISPNQLAVFRGRFLGGLEHVEAFEMSRMTGVEQDKASKSLRVIFRGLEGEPEEEIFLFAEWKRAEAVYTVLTGLLKEAEEKKKQEEEEAARLEKEELERQKQNREIFASEVWEISESLWLITKADYSMVKAVITADWDTVRQHYSSVWQQAEKLKNFNQIDLAITLKGLDEAVGSRRGEEVIRKASQLLTQLSDQLLQNEAAWAKWQDQKEMLVAVSPNCNHWPYFLLFTAAHFEALLSAQIEDWTGVDKSLISLRPSGTILQSYFSIDLEKLPDMANSAAMERNLDLYTETAQRVEDTVYSFFKEKPFKFETSMQLTKG